MKKRVFVIYGWSGYPDENWFPWLKKELESKGFEVHIPEMPDADNPRIEKWTSKLNNIVKNPDGNTFFVGHSMGCQTIARYLETLSEDAKIGGVIFVAGFFKRLTNLGNEEEERKTVRHWLETPINLEKVRSHMNKSVAIFSDDDPYVPLDNIDDFRDKLGSKIIVLSKQGHINESAGVLELPVVLEELLKMTRE